MKLVKDKLLRRYTPPTCTLELWGEQPIWQWRSSEELPADYRFSLHFDDPRLIDTPHVSLEGTSEQLIQLNEVVEGYLQDRLSQAFRADSAAAEPNQPIFGLFPLHPFHHGFNVGQLQAIPSLTESITLSTSQLFDLATALETFRLGEIEKSRLPASTEPDSPKLGFWAWSAILMAGLVTFGIGRIVLMNRQTNTADVQPNLSLSEDSLNQFQLAEVLPAIPPPPRPDTPPPVLAVPLALRDPLPSPSLVTAATSPIQNPNVAVVIPPQAVRPPALAAPAAPQRTVIPVPPQENLAVLVAPDVTPFPSAGTALTPQQNNPQLPPLATTAMPPAVPPLSRQRSLPPRSENLLDTIPQVTEVRKFYEQAWEPREEQTHTLEYRLTLARSGKIEKIVPMGKAASIWLTELPRPEAFSPLNTDRPETIRLVLTPVGDVKTFLED